MCALSSSNSTLLIEVCVSKEKRKMPAINSWGPAIGCSCVHYSCFHSKSNHPLCPACCGVIWFWLPPAKVVCWCACDLIFLFTECAVDTVQKKKPLRLCHILRGRKARSSDQSLCTVSAQEGYVISRYRVETLPLAPLFQRYFLTLTSH